VTAFYAALVGIGFALLAAALIWAWRARHARRLWHASHHAETVAIVLELEEHVRDLEAAMPPHTPAQ
jgi:hypothetical protein